MYIVFRRQICFLPLWELDWGTNARTACAIWTNLNASQGYSRAINIVKRNIVSDMELKTPQKCGKIGATNSPALSIFLGFFVYVANAVEITPIETIQFAFQCGT